MDSVKSSAEAVIIPAEATAPKEASITGGSVASNALSGSAELVQVPNPELGIVTQTFDDGSKFIQGGKGTSYLIPATTTIPGSIPSEDVSMKSEVGTGIDKGVKRAPIDETDVETDAKSVRRQSDSEAPSVASSVGGRKKGTNRT